MTARLRGNRHFRPGGIDMDAAPPPSMGRGERSKAPRAGEWSLPGGAQRLGERVRATAVREVREETGIEIGPLALIDVIDSIADHAGR